MQQCQRHRGVDRTVQPLPALAAQRLEHKLGRGDGQHQQHQPGGEAHQNKRALGNIGHDIAPVQPHVEPCVAKQVQASVEEHVQAQHAPVTHQQIPAGELTQRRHRQHDAEKTQSPVTGLAQQSLRWVGPQPIGRGRIEKPCEGQQAQRKDQRLGPGLEQPGLHQ